MPYRRSALAHAVTGLLIILSALLVRSSMAQKKVAPNFYAGGETPKPSPAKPPKVTATARPSRTPDATPRKAKATVTALPRVSAAPTKRSAKRAPTPAVAKATVSPSARPTPAVASTTLPTNSRTDPFLFSAFFRNPWSLNEFVVLAGEAVAFEQQALARKLSIAQETLTRATEAIELRQRNVLHAAAALSITTAFGSDSPLLRPGMAPMHEIALRAAIREDAEQLAPLLGDYDAAREATNKFLESQNKPGVAASSDTIWIPPDLNDQAAPVSIQTADVVRSQTQSLLQISRLDPALQRAFEATASLRNADAARIILRSLVPPLPNALLLLDIASFPELARLKDGDAPKRKAKPDMPAQAPPKHGGVIVRATGKQNVAAAADGTVNFAGDIRGLGNVVILEHADGLFSVYSFLASTRLTQNAKVKKGDSIGQADFMRGGLPADPSSPVARPAAFYFEVRRGQEAVAPSDLLGTLRPEDLFRN